MTSEKPADCLKQETGAEYQGLGAGRVCEKS